MNLFFPTAAHAMATNNGGGAEGITRTLIMIAVIFGIFYFLVIRPQKKQQDKHQSMISQLSKGDRVVTAGGIHGKVNSVQENTVRLEVTKDFKLTVEKGSISRVKGNKDGADEED